MPVRAAGEFESTRLLFWQCLGPKNNFVCDVGMLQTSSVIHGMLVLWFGDDWSIRVLQVVWHLVPSCHVGVHL